MTTYNLTLSAKSKSDMVGFSIPLLSEKEVIKKINYTISQLDKKEISKVNIQISIWDY